jgi:hypothetical protein
MGNLLSGKTSSKSLHSIRIEVTSQLQKFKQEYSNRNDQSMVEFFDDIDLEYNKRYIQKSKSSSNLAVTTTTPTTDTTEPQAEPQGSCSSSEPFITTPTTSL